jgi:hypothetical protein
VAALALATALIGTPPAWAVNIYKIVDEEGNVIYTDQPPAPGAQPLNLRELSVVPRPEYAPPPGTTAAPGSDEPSAQAKPEVPSLLELRRRYSDFRLVSPAPDQTFTGTANLATIAWDTGLSLLPGMAVRVYVDDEPMEPTTSDVIATERLDRGTHTTNAELLGPSGEVVATAGPVTFYMFQASALFPARRGGG